MEYLNAIKDLESLAETACQYNKLARFLKVLDMLDNPQDKYNIIHIAGTNGKGSTALMTDAVLRELKIRVGRYTSPHINDYTERIVVNGQEISKKIFTKYLKNVLDCYSQLEKEYGKPLIFEVLSAVAFYYFAESFIEWAVIETGLGGLLDCTNVVASKVAVITNVSFDHTDRLGKTIEDIAYQKAGIIKKGIPVVTATEGIALQIIKKTAKEKNAKVSVLGIDFFANKENNEKVCFVDDSWHFSYTLSLKGAFQRKNSALVIALMKVLQNKYLNIKSSKIKEAIVSALQHVCWQGRFEVFEDGENFIVLDGAHNEDGAKVLLESLKEYFFDYNLVFIFTVLKDKKVKEIVKILGQRECIVIITENSSKRAMAKEVMAEIWQYYNEKYNRNNQLFVADNLEDAFYKAKMILNNRKLENKKNVLCITGSLYMIGEAKTILAKY